MRKLFPLRLSWCGIVLHTYSCFECIPSRCWLCLTGNVVCVDLLCFRMISMLTQCKGKSFTCWCEFSHGFHSKQAESTQDEGSNWDWVNARMISESPQKWFLSTRSQIEFLFPEISKRICNLWRNDPESKSTSRFQTRTAFRKGSGSVKGSV